MSADRKLIRKEQQQAQQRQRAKDKKQAAKSLKEFLKEQKQKYSVQFAANSQFKNKDGSESNNFTSKENYSVTIYIGETFDLLEGGYPCKIFMDGAPKILFYVDEADYAKLKALLSEEADTLSDATKKLIDDFNSIEIIDIDNDEEVSRYIKQITQFNQSFREQEFEDNISEADRNALAVMRKEVQKLGNTLCIIQEVTSFSDKVKKADNLEQIKALEAELLTKIGQIQEEFVKEELTKKAIAITDVAKQELTEKVKVIADPFREKLQGANTEEDIMQCLHSFPQQLFVINQEFSKIASQKLQAISEAERSASISIFEEVRGLVKEIRIQCELKATARAESKKPEEVGFIGSFFSSGESAFEQSAVAKATSEKIKEIDEKLENTKDEQALEKLREAKKIAEKALIYAKIFFKGTDDEKNAAIDELEKLSPSISPASMPVQKKEKTGSSSSMLVEEKKKSSSSMKKEKKTENRRNRKKRPAISQSDMSSNENHDQEKSISECISLFEILERKKYSIKADAKIQPYDVKELLRKIELFYFQNSILSGFIKAVYPKLRDAVKKEEFTVEYIKQLYADIQIEYLGLLKAASELASSNVVDAKKAAEEKKNEMFRKADDIKKAKMELEGIEKEEESVGSIEDIAKMEAMQIRVEKNLFLSEIKEYAAPLMSEKSTEELTQSIINLVDVIKSGPNLIEDAVDRVSSVLEPHQSDIASKMAVCDLNIKDIEKEIEEESKGEGEIDEFGKKVINLNNKLSYYSDEDLSEEAKANRSLKKELQVVIDNFLNHFRLDEKNTEEEDSKKNLKGRNSVLLAAEKENVIYAINQFLKANNISQKDRSIASKYKRKFIQKKCSDQKPHQENKDYAKFKLQEEKSTLQVLYDSLTSAVSNIKKASRLFFEKIVKVYAEFSKLMSDRKELEQKKNTLIGRLKILETDEKRLQDELAALNKKTAQAVAEKKQLDATISEEHDRLEAMITEPFRLFIVTSFFINEEYFKGIRNAIILDNKNKAHFIINGKIVLDKSGQQKEVAISDRHSIPMASELDNSTEPVKLVREITNYEGVCDVIEQAAQKGNYKIRYDIEAEKIAEKKAVGVIKAGEEARKYIKEKEDRERENKKKEEKEKEQLILKEDQRKAAELERQQHPILEEKKTTPEKAEHDKEKIEALERKNMEALRCLKDKAITIQSKKKEVAAKQTVKHFGALTLDGAAQEGMRKTKEKSFVLAARNQLSTQRELEQERIKLEAELVKLEQLYQIVLNYHNRNLYAEDIDIRKKYRNTLCAEIKKCPELLKKLSVIYNALQKDDSLCTPYFLVNLDKLASILFEYVTSAEVKDLEMVSHIVKNILPLLAENDENSPLFKFREVDEANSKVSTHLQRKPKEIAQVKADLKDIKKKLLELQSQGIFDTSDEIALTTEPVFSPSLSPVEKRPEKTSEERVNSSTDIWDQVMSFFSPKNVGENLGQSPKKELPCKVNP